MAKKIRKYSRVRETAQTHRVGTVQQITGSGPNQHAVVSFDGWLRLKKKVSELNVI